MRFPRRFVAGALALTLLPGGIMGQAPDGPIPQAAQVLTLYQAVQLALDHHPAIGEARARIDIAAGALRQAEAARFPTISSDASLARYQEPWLVAPLHGFDPTMAPEFDRNLVRGNLTVGYSIYDGGARAARIGQAESGQAMAVAGQAASQLDITAQASATFLEILSAAELLEAAGSQREALEAELLRVGQFLAEGKAARVDLLRVQAALSQTQAAEVTLRSRLEVAQGRLARLTGLSGGDIRGASLAPVRLRSSSRGQLPETLARARDTSPELELARNQLASASAGARVARANRFPTVQAAGAYSDFGALDEEHTLEWQGSLSVSFPLFTGGARKGERERASAEERRATEALRWAELAVEGGVEEALAAVEEARAVREALESGVEQAAEVARIEALALEIGSGVQTEFLRAQSELFHSRAALAQARHGEVMTTVQLARVTGELSLEWLQENMEVVR
jgi:outer membrane protein